MGSECQCGGVRFLSAGSRRRPSGNRSLQHHAGVTGCRNRLVYSLFLRCRVLLSPDPRVRAACWLLACHCGVAPCGEVSAICAGNDKLLHKLIEMGAGVSVMVEGGPAPLHVAVDQGSEAAVKALLEVGTAQPANSLPIVSL